MKNLLIIPMLFACYICMGQSVDSASIIGKSIRIGNLIVAQYDFRTQMNWDDANLACASLGNGWRLPTRDELHILWKNKVKIGSFKYPGYWSSTEGTVDDDGFSGLGNESAWCQNFPIGGDPANYSKEVEMAVRAVRNFNNSIH